MSRAFRALKITAVPLLFAAAALGLATVHISLERKAARAKMRRRACGPGARRQSSRQPCRRQACRISRRQPSRAIFRPRSRWPAAWPWARASRRTRRRPRAYFQSVVDQLGEIGAHDKRAPLAATAYRFLAQFTGAAFPEPISRPIPPTPSTCCTTPRAISAIQPRSTNSLSC